jgi:hypothetical protein
VREGVTPTVFNAAQIVQRTWRLFRNASIAQARAEGQWRLTVAARCIECRAMSHVICILSQQQPRDIIAAVLSAVRSD